MFPPRQPSSMASIMATWVHGHFINLSAGITIVERARRFVGPVRSLSGPTTTHTADASRDKVGADRGLPFVSQEKNISIWW